MIRKVLAILFAVVASIACVLSDIRTPAMPVFTATQAKVGEVAYEESCARCHGINLKGSAFGPALVGEAFIQRWSGKSVGRLLSKVEATMPPDGPRTLPRSTYTGIIAYILETYGLEGGSTALPNDASLLDEIRIPSRTVLEVRGRSSVGSLLASDVTLPGWRVQPNPLEKVRPVSDELLEQPPDGSWLSWRRTRDAVGFSPLKQITKANARDLRVAWSLALPPGPNESTPLVHDGVIFVQSYGEHIQALDASTGDELWHYYHELPQGVQTLIHRNIALYNDKVYFTTSDAHVIALRMRTGEIVWEQPIGDPRNRTNRATAGPLIVKGVVMQGVLGSAAPGGGYVVGLNAETGDLLWRFYTIAQPGEPNGNSWNGLSREERTGGSIWTAGSYAKEEGLALFGPSPTYDTEPLRMPVVQPGVTNDALYTNATVALEPQTGKLAWYYQHFPNDQWDLDWAFERHVVSLAVNGIMRRLVITAGKEAVYDALDARTGQYVFSIDLGLQNLITKIDPRTGAKEINRELLPEDGKRVTICPDSAGAKSWLPGSYDPTSRILYVPLVEACMDIAPARRGQFNRGQVFELRPRSDSDGKYGRLQAINLENQQTVWMTRQRAPQTSGVLVTAGGVLFAGALDRWFNAYAADTGESLWRMRLSDVPNSSPISYAINGKQYVVMVVGAGYGQALQFYPLVPELRAPAAPSSAIWVFTLEE